MMTRNTGIKTSITKPLLFLLKMKNLSKIEQPNVGISSRIKRNHPVVSRVKQDNEAGESKVFEDRSQVE
jgi:hypothetical protein